MTAGYGTIKPTVELAGTKRSAYQAIGMQVRVLYMLRLKLNSGLYTGRREQELLNDIRYCQMDINWLCEQWQIGSKYRESREELPADQVPQGSDH